MGWKALGRLNGENIRVFVDVGTAIVHRRICFFGFVACATCRNVARSASACEKVCASAYVRVCGTHMAVHAVLRRVRP